MGFSFSTALSGLRANSDALGVTGNNIANSNTTAYKANTISFADVYNSSIGLRLNGAGNPLQIGGGVRTAAINTDYSQGTISESGSPTSAAIRGNGFFVIKEGNSEAVAYTRDGSFELDREGYLTTAGGQRVQGYAAVNGIVPPTATLTSMHIPVGQTLAPAATTEATLRLNLNSAAADGAEFHAPVQVYDSLGKSHVLDMVFKRTGDLTYTLSATLDGNSAPVNTSANITIEFDENGELVAPTDLKITPDQAQLDGATLPEIAINLFEKNADGSQGPSTWKNFAAPSAVAATIQDGYSAGETSGITFRPDGAIAAVFTNGQTRVVGQLALATFHAHTALTHLGGNLFGETVSSGQPSIGAPGTAGRGEIVGGSLEGSNVDLATEFTNLIVAQRGFQANSRVITTINQTMQDLLQTI